MTKSTQIANAKISLAMTSAIKKLRAEVEAIHRRAAAKQMLQSGNTIVEVKNECLSTLIFLGDLVSQELCWVLSQTFFVSPVTIDTCNILARQNLGFAYDECSAVLRRTVGMCGDDRHFALTEPELRNQEQRSLMGVSLALDARYSELKLQGLRTLLGVFQRFLSLLFGRA